MARRDDAAAMRAIYEPIVRETVISFELEPPTVDAFRERIMQRLETHPWLVTEREGQVVGYAYALPFRTRPAYQWTAEVSVYVDAKCHRTGIGRTLYRSLFSVLALLGYRTLVAGIALPNPASVALHERMGFESVGVFKHVGFKFDRWIDVSWYSRWLDEKHDAPSRSPTALSQWTDHAALDRAIGLAHSPGNR